jgi:hypothetical protein
MTAQGRLRVFTAVVAAAVAAAVVAGILVLGSPAEQRHRRLDLRRVDDLDTIAREIRRYWTTYQRLPTKLGDLPNSSYAGRQTDPTTALAYEYRVTEAKAFELCAVFESESRSEPPYWVRSDIDWTHGRGRHCFQVNAGNIE